MERKAGNQMKRTGYLSWDEYFMGIAMLSAQRSKDAESQVGACVVNSHHKILSVGYNGMPTGCPDDNMPWEKEGAPLETKHLYLCHACLNAILNSAAGLFGCTIYTTLFPCNECAKAIIQSGIHTVIYRDENPDADAVAAARRMFDMAGVKYRAYHRAGETVALEL